MSLDATLLSIEKSLSRIAAALESRSTVAPAAPVVHAPAPVQPVYAPVLASVPAPVAMATPAPVQQFAATGNPFGKDEAGGEQTLMGYTMDAYRTMGPLKGGGINNVLIAMNCKNINDVQPAQYAQFHGAVEALKVSA